MKIVANRCHILRLKCTKFDLGWGSAQTLLGSSQHSPRPLAGLEGSYFDGKEREGKGGKRKQGMEEEKREV